MVLGVLEDQGGLANQLLGLPGNGGVIQRTKQLKPLLFFCLLPFLFNQEIKSTLLISSNYFDSVIWYKFRLVNNARTKTTFELSNNIYLRYFANFKKHYTFCMTYLFYTTYKEWSWFFDPFFSNLHSFIAHTVKYTNCWTCLSKHLLINVHQATCSDTTSFKEFFYILLIVYFEEMVWRPREGDNNLISYILFPFVSRNRENTL